MEIRRKPRIRFRAMRGVGHARLNDTVKTAGGVLGKLKIDNTTDTNDTIYYGAFDILRAKNKKIDGRKEPWWKKRLARYVKEMK